MKALKYMNEEEVLKKGMKILMKEPGPVETARFLNIPGETRAESVKGHREWQKSLSRDDFLKVIFD
jgi:hypothetical protein